MLMEEMVGRRRGTLSDSWTGHRWLHWRIGLYLVWQVRPYLIDLRFWRIWLPLLAPS